MPREVHETFGVYALAREPADAARLARFVAKEKLPSFLGGDVPEEAWKPDATGVRGYASFAVTRGALPSVEGTPSTGDGL